MTYQQVASISAGCSTPAVLRPVCRRALIYAFWPGNKKRFERAARLPLEQGSESTEDEKDN